MSLIRRALIIGSPDASIPGVRIDMRNWQNFLISDTAGAWEKTEIQVLENPTRAILSVALNKLNISVDYAFIAFSGHGEVNQNGQTVIHINDRESMPANALRGESLKQSIVIDCCRVPIVRKALVESSLTRIMAMDGMTNRAVLRRKFDSSIADCDPGLVRLYSCSIGQTAGESEQFGGYYSHSLMNSALPVSGVKTIRQAHQEAVAKVAQLRPNQTPTGEFPRSRSSFAFSVS